MITLLTKIYDRQHEINAQLSGRYGIRQVEIDAMWSRVNQMLNHAELWSE